jgi:hypothetical protein
MAKNCGKPNSRLAMHLSWQFIPERNPSFSLMPE